MLGWAEIVAATGQFLWPGTGISTVRLWAVFHGRQHTRSAKVFSFEVFMDGSPLPTANTGSRSIISFAPRTVATSLGCSIRQLHLSATTLTSRHYNRSCPSLTESSGQGLNRHGNVCVVTSQDPGSLADRDEQSPTRPIDRRNRVDHGGK